MSIYRGAGGAGDAVADSSSEALLVRELAIEVQADADAAAASATNASNSASSASTSATNAANSASAASTSATNAASSASTATTKASEASTSATNAASSASAASTSASAAATSATNASNSASSASTSASTATTQATNASNSASAAATSATNASNSATAAATSATNAASSATSASGSATSAATQASNASTSATNAAASATSASGSATTATTQAGIATTQATNASNSATAAATSATNAATSASDALVYKGSAVTAATDAANSATSAGNSATSAAASAAAAAASYDSFDDRYLGVKTAAPTLDNDGNALVTGALYYNDGTVTPANKGMWVYDGSTWIAASAASTAILTVYRYTATAGQTTFTGADDNSLTLTYTPGSAIITINGAVMEVGTDVTATTGTSIVLAQAALVGDEVNVYAFATFNVANVLQNTSPSILSGNLNFATTGQRITGDFTNATTANRVAFQTSTTNSNTNIYALPNGTAAASGWNAFNNSDPTNAAYIRILANSTSYTAVESSITGTGTYLPLTMWTGGSERLRIDTGGNVGIGTNSPGAKFHVSGGVILVDNNQGYQSKDAGGTARAILILNSSDELVFQNNSGGDGGVIRFNSQTGGVESMRIDTSGNVGIGTSSPIVKLDVAGALRSIVSGGTPQIYFNDGTYQTNIVGSGNAFKFIQSSVETMRIDSSGNLLAGCTTTLNVATSGNYFNNGTTAYIGTGHTSASPSGASYTAYYYNAGYIGGITQNGSTGVLYNTSSDYRLKDITGAINGSEAKEFIMALQPKQGTWKADGSKFAGFVAHEFQEVSPSSVSGEKDAVDADGNPVMQSMQASSPEVMANLVALMQEQQKMIEELKAEVAALKGTV